MYRGQGYRMYFEDRGTVQIGIHVLLQFTWRALFRVNQLVCDAWCTLIGVFLLFGRFILSS